MPAVYLGPYRFSRSRIVSMCIVCVLLAGSVLGPSFGTVSEDHVAAEARWEPLRSVMTADRKIALTFNLSWGEEIHDEIRKILSEHQARATFFISGPWANAHPADVRNILNEQHEVGSLGYRQVDWSQYPEATIRDEILRAQRELQPLLGRPPVYLRPPSGDVDEKVLNASAALNQTLVLWNIDSQDWATPGIDTISERVVRRAVPGSIVLLHASDTAQETPQALRSILAQLMEKGYTFVTLSELLGETKNDTQEVDAR